VTTFVAFVPRARGQRVQLSFSYLGTPRARVSDSRAQGTLGTKVESELQQPDIEVAEVAYRPLLLREYVISCAHSVAGLMWEPEQVVGATVDDNRIIQQRRRADCDPAQASWRRDCGE
jgi:hypothetical protein